MNSAWWAAFGPADASLRCGDAEHRLRWADGTLQAPDHPDAEGELVLGALGGDTNPCLDMVMAWGRHSDDLTVLAAGPRSADDSLTFSAALLDELTAASGLAGQVYHGLGNPMAQLRSSGGLFIRARPVARAIAAYGPGTPGRVASHGRLRSAGSVVREAGNSINALLARLGTHGGPARQERRIRRPGRPTAVRLARPTRFPMTHSWSGYAPFGWHQRLAGGWGGPETDEARVELIRLLALGPPFQFRLSAAVAHAWSADGPQADRAERARPALTAALAGRLAPAAAQWLDIDPDEVEVNIHDSAGWGELVLAKAGETGRLQARLPVGWLASVWAPGFAVIDGRLVVSVLDAAWPTARVLAVRSPGREPAELSIRNDKGHWSVASR